MEFSKCMMLSLAINNSLIIIKKQCYFGKVKIAIVTGQAEGTARWRVGDGSEGTGLGDDVEVRPVYIYLFQYF